MTLLTVTAIETVKVLALGTFVIVDKVSTVGIRFTHIYRIKESKIKKLFSDHSFF